MGQILQELKRRNVFRVGVAYIVVAWLIIQVIATVSEPLGLPDWTETLFIVVLLAVLPFVNMSADPDQEYFSDGISEELLNVIVKVDGLRVASRTSSFSLSNLSVDSKRD